MGDGFVQMTGPEALRKAAQAFEGHGSESWEPRDVTFLLNHMALVLEQQEAGLSGDQIAIQFLNDAADHLGLY